MCSNEAQFFNFRFEKINGREQINVGPISCLGGSANRTTWRSQLRTKNLAVSQPIQKWKKAKSFLPLLHVMVLPNPPFSSLARVRTSPTVHLPPPLYNWFKLTNLFQIAWI